MIRFFVIGILFHVIQARSFLDDKNIKDTCEERIDKSSVPGRYPYQVRLIGGDSGHFGCGGSLIEPEWVLSAAACAGFATHVEIGRYNTSDSNETFEEIDIEFEAIHPFYDSSSNENDLMLIKLANPSNYTTATVNDGSIDLSAGTNVTVIGWGLSFSNRILQITTDPSDVHQEERKLVVDHDECRFTHRAYIVSEDMLCAFDRTNIGDTGGPWIIKGDNATSDVVVGATSWFRSCDRPKVAALFNTSLDFIHEITNCTYAEGDDATTFEGCSSVTCGTDGSFTCAVEGDYNCLDFKQDGFDYSSCQSDISNVCYLSDGICDLSLNNEECNYDGGDCCVDNCYGGRSCYVNYFYACIDPTSDATFFLSAVMEFLISVYDPLTRVLDAFVLKYTYGFPILVFPNWNEGILNVVPGFDEVLESISSSTLTFLINFSLIVFGE